MGEPDVNYLGLVKHPGYLVGDDGSVWSCWTPQGRMGTWKRMTPGVKKDGYHVYKLRTAPRTYVSRNGHALVIAAFRGARLWGLECRHLDGDPGNNRISNLVWGTSEENERDRAAHGTVPVGSAVHSAKLSEADVKEIKKLLASGVPQRVLARRFGVRIETICRVSTGKAWSHVPAAAPSR